MKGRYIRVFLNDGTVYVSKHEPADSISNEEWAEAAKQTYELMDDDSPGKFRMDLADGGILITRLANVHHLEYREEWELIPDPLPPEPARAQP